jgi:hypothetical protein
MVAQRTVRSVPTATGVVSFKLKSRIRRHRRIAR